MCQILYLGESLKWPPARPQPAQHLTGDIHPADRHQHPKRRAAAARDAEQHHKRYLGNRQPLCQKSDRRTDGWLTTRHTVQPDHNPVVHVR
jgi:hypothetical protein